MTRYTILWAILGMAAWNFVVAQDTKGVDFYREFGSNPALSFLKDNKMGDDIHKALNSGNARALGGYAAILFYAERVSGRQISQVTGLKLLDQATQIAMSQRDGEALGYLAHLWEEEYFGPGDKPRAESLRKYMYKLKYEIALTLPKESVLVHEEISLSIKYVGEVSEAVPLEELSIQARHGKIITSWNRISYRAPAFSCEDEIQVKYLPSGHTSSVTVLVGKPSWGIRAIPAKENALLSEEISLRVEYLDTQVEVPMEKLSFKASDGGFRSRGNQMLYVAPGYPCDASVEVTYLPNGHTASVTIHVIKRTDGSPSVPYCGKYSPYQPCTRKTPPIVDPSEFLRKEEEARVQAQENMVKEIQEIISHLARYYNEFRDVQSRLGSKDFVLVGVTTGDPYVCVEDPQQKLRVLATLSPENAVKSMRLNCRRNNVPITESMEEKFIEVIENKSIEVEGYVRYLK